MIQKMARGLLVRSKPHQLKNLTRIQTSAVQTSAVQTGSVQTSAVRPAALESGQTQNSEGIKPSSSRDPAVHSPAVESTPTRRSEAWSALSSGDAGDVVDLPGQKSSSGAASDVLYSLIGQATSDQDSDLSENLPLIIAEKHDQSDVPSGQGAEDVCQSRPASSSRIQQIFDGHSDEWSLDSDQSRLSLSISHERTKQLRSEHPSDQNRLRFNRSRPSSPGGNQEMQAEKSQEIMQDAEHQCRPSPSGMNVIPQADSSQNATQDTDDKSRPSSSGRKTTTGADLSRVAVQDVHHDLLLASGDERSDESKNVSLEEIGIQAASPQRKSASGGEDAADQDRQSSLFQEKYASMKVNPEAEDDALESKASPTVDRFPIDSGKM